MSTPKFLLIGSVFLFGSIGMYGLYKRLSKDSKEELVVLHEEVSPAKRGPPKVEFIDKTPKNSVVANAFVEKLSIGEELPDVDRTFELFTTGSLKLPIVETVTYSSHVPWLQGRLAWVADYAAHYGTSRHFIARSLNGQPDYFSQTVQEGSHFNVYKLDKNFEFYLVVDLSRCKMALYYHDLDTQERVLIKTYQVGVGRLDPESSFKTATPLGHFMVGDKVAIYKPGMRGYYNNQEVEMMQIFGTRWLPLGNGYGIQGAPWHLDPKTGALIEDRSVIGQYATDGGIRLAHEDLEELYAIVITKPTHVVIVTEFHQAQLPGQEVAIPRRI